MKFSPGPRFVGAFCHGQSIIDALQLMGNRHARFLLSLGFVPGVVMGVEVIPGLFWRGGS